MTINCNGTLVDLSLPKVMGILNVTLDSFYDGGTHKNLSDLMRHTEKMLEEGATFIDIGAYSSKPNAALVSETEELARILPIVELIIKTFPSALISIDTFRSHVAKSCIDRGAAIINDISAGKLDPKMLSVVAKNSVPYIMMHMRGTPQTMQNNTDYEHLINDIMFYFSEQIQKAKAEGIIDLIIDPGFGFAKTTAQNFELLNKLDHFQLLEHPVIVGLSRKSMIYKTLEKSAQDALNGTTVLHTIALQKKASILRVHDVKEAMECIKLVQGLKS